jgi:hypothetical protein
MADDIVNQLLPFVMNEVRMPAGFVVTVINHIEAQQAEIERLRAERDAIDALHQPWTEGDNWCKTCDVAWPCMTARLLHPEEARRG